MNKEKIIEFVNIKNEQDPKKEEERKAKQKKEPKIRYEYDESKINKGIKERVYYDNLPKFKKGKELRNNDEDDIYKVKKGNGLRKNVEDNVIKFKKNMERIINNKNLSKVNKVKEVNVDYKDDKLRVNSENFDYESRVILEEEDDKQKVDKGKKVLVFYEDDEHKINKGKEPEIKFVYKSEYNKGNEEELEYDVESK